MKTARRIASLALAAIMVLSLAACGNSESPGGTQTAPPAGPSASTPAAPEGIAAGSEVNFCLSSDIANYLPTTVSSVPGFIACGSLYEGLMWYPAGATEPSPCLAERYEISEDGLTYTFHIRSGVSFTNGETLTSSDVAYSWEARKSLNESEFTTIDHWECPDESTFVVYLTSPRASFLNEICDIFWSVVSEKAYREFGITDNKAAAGTGPYYVDEYVAGSRMVLKANENYWNTDYMPTIETVNLEVIADNNTAFISLQSGHIDIMREINAMQKSMLEGNSQFTISAYPDPCVDTLFFNTSRAPFDNAEVRRAISYLINKDDVNSAAYDGTGTTTHCLWPNNSGIYVEESVLSQYYTYDKEKGLQILSDAGYAPSDISFEILAPSSSSAQMLAVENIQAQLLGLGMDVKVTTYDRPTYMAYIRDQDYQCAIHDIGTTLDKNQAFGNSFVSNGLNHFNNFMSTEPEFQQKIDAMWEEALGCTTMEEQNEILREATQMLAEQYACVPLIEKSIYFAVNAGLQGLVVNHDTYPRFYGLYWAQ